MVFSTIISCKKYYTLLPKHQILCRTSVTPLLHYRFQLHPVILGLRKVISVPPVSVSESTLLVPVCRLSFGISSITVYERV